jgi:hypothetical protein
MQDIGKNILKLTFALLKNGAKQAFGEEALGIAAETLVEIGGDKAQASLEAVLGTKDGTLKLIESAQKADEYFRNKCEDNDLRQAFTLSMGNLPSIQAELAELPTSMDEDSLLEILRGNLKRDFPNLTDHQIELGVTLYADCLHRALLPLKEFTLQIIGQVVLDNKSKLNEIGSDVQKIKSIVEKLPRKEQEMTASKSVIFKTQEYTLKPWIQPLFLNKLDDKFNAPQLKLSDLIISNPRIVLVGSSGSGKTDALKLAANELNQSSGSKCVWIPLKNYTNNLGYTIKTILGWYDLQDNQVFRVLQEYKITLLLDGLNEVTNENLDNCVNEIQSLLDTYQGQICISHSINDLAYFGFEYTTYNALPLNKAQIEKTIIEFFRAKEFPHRAGWFLQSVRGNDPEKQKVFDKLAELPINLQFFLELAEEDDYVFNSMLDLYGQLIQKRLERTKNYSERSQVSSEIKTDCLMNVAYEAIIKDKPLQMQKEFVRSIFLKAIGPLKGEIELALQEIIRAGLLLEVNDFLVEWPHASFRDYLAGRQLFKLVEIEQTFDEFPLDKLNGFMAAAHATRLLTTQSRSLEKRPTIFMSTIKRNPSFEIMKTVAEEYQTALEYYSSTDENLRCDANIFTKIQWGERFLEAYQLIKDVARKNNLSDIEEIPSPQGLNVFFDAESQFCLLTFSENKGIQFDEIENFSNQVSRRKRKKKTKTGFCLYSPFLLLLDPEIVAYLEVGLWLRLRSKTQDTENILNKWHNGLSIYNITPRGETIYWNRPDKIPEPNFEICATPKDTMNFLYKNFGVEQTKQIQSITDIITTSKKEILDWWEMCMPITFQIDAIKTKGIQKVVSNRLSQMMVQTFPDHNISLLFFVPYVLSSMKIDFGINTFVPFPVPIFNRYYFMYNMQMTFINGKSHFLVHLRG